MILIFNRQDIKNVVPIGFLKGMWGIHEENLHKYDLNGIEPVKKVENLKDAGTFYKENGLNLYGQDSKINHI